MVDAYLASERGADASAYAREQLRHQDGAALGFVAGRHGLDEVHSLRLFFERVAAPKSLAPISGCRPFRGASLAHELAHWKMTPGTRTS
jgi:hypothetical protein